MFPTLSTPYLPDIENIEQFLATSAETTAGHCEQCL